MTIELAHPSHTPLTPPSNEVITPVSVRFCQIWLTSRLLPRAQLSDAYVPIKSPRYKDVVVLAQEIQGLFCGAPDDNFLSCCENIHMSAIEELVGFGNASEHVVVIELQYMVLKHESVMPVYAAVTLDSIIYCFSVSKLLVQCMTNPVTIIQLMQHLQRSVKSNA